MLHIALANKGRLNASQYRLDQFGTALNSMAEIWRPEDFLPGASDPLDAKDFWDPDFQEIAPIDLIAPFPRTGSHRSPFTGQVKPKESVDGARDRDDFLGERLPVETIDAWEPIEATPAPFPSVKLDGGFDFWEPSPVVEAPSVHRSLADDWSVRIPFPSYDPSASENPFSGFFSEDRQEILPEKRARWLLSMLGVRGNARQRRYLSAFTDIFIEYPHHSTFRALSDLALEDLTADDFISAFILKQTWNDFPLFSSIRTRRRELFIASNRSSLLGWKHAVQLITQSRGLPPEQIINPDWYDDWLNIPYGDPLYWRFLDYLDARIDSVEAGALDALPTNRRSAVSPIKDISIDGFSPFNNFSRTSMLTKGYTDRWEYSCDAPTAPKSSENADIDDG